MNVEFPVSDTKRNVWKAYWSFHSKLKLYQLGEICVWIARVLKAWTLLQVNVKMLKYAQAAGLTLSPVHQKRLLCIQVVRRCWHAYACKMWPNISRGSRIMDIFTRRTDRRTHTVIIADTYGSCNKTSDLTMVLMLFIYLFIYVDLYHYEILANYKFTLTF